MSPLPARAAYRLWAASYDSENAVSFLENQLAEALAPAGAARRLLDAGCGTGRRLRSGRAYGVDLSPEMLQAGVGRGRVAAADLRALPFPDRSFDLVWCRLAVGHVPELDAVYAELARVCDAGGGVFISDFHPAAAAAGHRRTFRDATGERHEVEHFVHPDERHEALAGSHGLQLRARRDGVVGPPVEAFYAAHGMVEQYRAQLGLPLVLALLYERGPAR
ncbi:MAG TPA: methyltransferase domain-containing protein [Longimicrobiales bacterium]|nr:methyltransferase domain-containing protein [Longimicrobiales bacterium]